MQSVALSERGFIMRFIVILTMLIIVFASFYVKGEEIMKSQLLIDLDKTLLTFQGFGVSGAWWAQDIGNHPECREKIANLLFNKEDGIGLPIYRYYIGAGEPNNIFDPWRKAKCLEVAPGKYDLLRDKGAFWVLEKAIELGVTKVVAFAYSPPARMTISGTVDGGKSGISNLRDDMYDDFANYLVDIVELLISKGIPVKELSPVNEPQWFWNSSKGQEGCHYEPEEVVRLLKKLLKVLDERNLNIKIAAPESGDWKSAKKYAEAMFSDPLINEKIKEFHVHSYWSNSFHKKRFVNFMERKFPGKRIIMSEWTEMTNGRDTSMESALEMARIIIEDILIGKAIEWHYWIAVSKYDFRDGLIYVDYEKDGSIILTETKRLWVLGNFSKFVRPGFRVISSSFEKKGYLNAITFESPDNKEIVVIVVNPSKTLHELSVEFKNRDLKLRGIYVTDKDHDLEFVNSNSGDYLLIPPRSVVTLLYNSDPNN